MAGNIGNINLTLGLDLNALRKGLQDAEQAILALKNKMQDPQKDFLGSNNVSKKLKELDKAFRSIEWDKDLDGARDSALRLAQAFTDITTANKESTMSLRQYVRELERQGRMSLSTTEANNLLAKTGNISSIASRQNRIKELQDAVRRLDQTDRDYITTLTRLNREISRLTRENQKYMSSGIEVEKQTMKMGNAAAWAARKLAFYTSIYSIERFVSRIREVRGEFELQQRSLAAIIQNKQEADKIFQQTVSLALQSPFQLRQLVTYTKELSAYRIETEKLFDTTKMLADVSAGLGVDMGRLILAYGQVRSAAVLRGQELRQFTEAGIPIIAELAKKFSELYGRVVDTSEVFELVSKRLVPFAMVDEIFKDMTREGGVFFNMQKIQAETLQGKWSNLKDAYDIMLNKMGTETQDTMKWTIDLLRLLAENYQLVMNTLMSLIGAYGLYIVSSRAASLATGRFAAEVLKGTGVLKIFANMTYGDAMLSLKHFSSAALGTSKSMMVLQKSVIVANAALKGLKAVGVSLISTFLPLLAVFAAIEGVLLIINRNRKIREVSEDTEKYNSALILSNKTINTHIERLKELSSEYATLKDVYESTSSTEKEKLEAYKKLQRIEGERAGLISEISKTESTLAKNLDQTANSYEGLVKEQEKHNEMLRQTILLRGLLASESPKRTQDLMRAFADYEDSSAKFEARRSEVESIYASVEYRIKSGSLKIEKYQQDMLNNIISGSGDALDKLSRIVNMRGVFTSSNLDDIFGSFDRSIVSSTRKQRDAVNNSFKTIEKSAQSVANEWRQSFLAANIDITNSSQEVINYIRRALEQTTSSKTLSNIIAQFMGLPEAKDITKPLSGWKKVLSDTFEGSTVSVKSIISDDQATLLSTLDTLYTEREELEKQYNQYMAMSAENRVTAISDAELEGMRANIKRYNNFLNFYNYQEKEKGKAKDAVTQAWKEEIALIEKAKSAYDGLAKFMAKSDAASKVSKMFGISPDMFTSNEAVLSRMSSVRAQAMKRNTEEAKALFVDLSDRMTKLDIDISQDSLKSAKKRIDDAFGVYELTLKLKDVVGIDARGLLGETLSFDALQRMAEEEVRRLRGIGGDENIAQALEIEEKIKKIRIDKAIETYNEIEKLRDGLATTPEKIAALEKRIFDLQLEYAVLLADGKKKAELELTRLRIANAQKELGALREEAFKTTDIYTRLFGDLTDLTVSQLRSIIDDSQKLVDGLKWNEDKKAWSKFDVSADGIPKEVTFSPEEYLRILKQIASIQEDLRVMQPFKRVVEDFKALNKEGLDVEQKAQAMSKFLGSVGNYVKEIGEIASEVAGLADALGVSEETSRQINGIIEVIGGAGEVASGVGQITEGKVVEGIKSIVRGLANIVKGIINIGDPKYDRIIRKHQERIDDMQRAYERLAESMSKAFDMQKFLGDVRAMDANIRNQIASLNAMRQAEESKKRTDRDKLKDYAKQIQDLSKRQQDMWEEFYEGLRGTNIKSAADDLASIWVEAVLNSENAMTAIEKRFDDMIKQIIIKQASLRIVGQMLKPLFDQIDNAFADDGIMSDEEMRSISDSLPQLVKRVNEALENTIRPLLDASGIVEKGLGGSGLQRGIQSVTEDTASQLVALLNTMRYEVIKQSSTFVNMDISLLGIHNVVSDQLYYTKEIHSIIAEMRSWQKSITFSGHPKGGSGLKIFSDE